MNTEIIKSQIIAALSHPEAEQGLYLDNLLYVHEDEERPLVDAEQEDVLECLKDLIGEGKVKMDDEGEKIIFILLPS
jgi:uncharacterized protein YfeS